MMLDRSADNADLPRRRAGILRAARSIVDQTLRAGSQAYVRERDLPRLLRIMPQRDRRDTSAELEMIVRLLERALRAERNRARSGHWTYDLNRHIALHQAHLAERKKLEAMTGKRMG
jgi:hypothetical protein